MTETDARTKIAKIVENIRDLAGRVEDATEELEEPLLEDLGDFQLGYLIGTVEAMEDSLFYAWKAVEGGTERFTQFQSV